MRSIRWRLTFAYALALLTSMVAFGASLYFARHETSLRSFDQRLQQRLQLEAELSARYLGESYRVLGRIVARDSTPALEPTIAAFFESFRDYLVIADSGGRVLFASDSASSLPIASFERLRAPLRSSPRALANGSYTFDPASGPARYLVLPIDSAGPEVAAVLVAAPSTTTVLEAEALLQSMLVIAPLILLASVLVGYWVAGRNLEPLGTMVRELEAITDGTSLHRRLAVERTHDEVARLGSAVNLMFERLERSFAALHRFTAEASHELKTPLMVLRAGVERALRNPGTPPESLQALDESLLHINRMAEMVDSLLTLARADEGRLPLAVEECDIRELVGEAAETASMLAEAAEIVVTVTIPDAPVPLAVDRNRIRQLLLNLVTNAVKYTPQGGAVSLGLSDQGGMVTVTVGDTGIGIAAGDLQHIFDRFWRADPARSRIGESPGTGLGLAITKWIAEAHGGSISVQSRPGRGTLFTVGLPRRTAAESTVS
ncbi:MAG: HAMP domain-containing protein [Gemmatimonadales bacterium]|nr:HAMP domain-containing protein [Gemmatimonadales bacterium]